MTSAYIPGFLLGLSLIVAIGAQNAFVLRQGLRGEHVFLVCFICAASDAVLISLGVGGFGRLSAALPWLAPVMRYGGALFLLAYAARTFWSAWKKGGSLSPAEGQKASLSAALLACLAFTWLNPHVYLDTVVLLGSVSTRYAGAKLAFGLGAATASVLFFFSLGYGARLLRPLLAKPSSWRVLDAVIGFFMLAIAVNLVV